MSRVTLQIEGMSCGHCLNAVNRALRGVAGATIDKVDIGRAVVDVTGPEVIPVLERAVADAGYRATVVSQA